LLGDDEIKNIILNFENSSVVYTEKGGVSGCMITTIIKATLKSGLG